MISASIRSRTFATQLSWHSSSVGPLPWSFRRPFVASNRVTPSNFSSFNSNSNDSVGADDGAGLTVGIFEIEGFDDGTAVGDSVGERLGAAVGAKEGPFAGLAVGSLVGSFVGDAVGDFAGEAVSIGGIGA